MIYYCTVPMDIKEDSSGGVHYVHCGYQATHFVGNSDWCVCEKHVGYAKSKKWPLSKIEEETNDKEAKCGC